MLPALALLAAVLALWLLVLLLGPTVVLLTLLRCRCTFLLLGGLALGLLHRLALLGLLTLLLHFRY